MRCSWIAYLIIWFIQILVPVLVNAEDFYEMLGVSRDADNRAIRRAFKKIALQKHPDKNPDKGAHAEFVRLNRAYEVLMNEELRKKYDQYGDEGLKDDFQGGQQYQSWQFYRDNFGIYDEDPEIVTLSRSDFQQEVVESGELWFVNFYSTFCSHCHHLAPTWRKFAKEIEGALRIGAVNCAEDPMLCQSQNVMGYPSLVLYPMGIFYNGQRELSALMEFALNHIVVEIHELSKSNVQHLSVDSDQYAKRGWVIDFCDDHDDCLTEANRKKLAAMLKGSANIATVNCFTGSTKDSLCDDLQRTHGVLYYPPTKIEQQYGMDINSLDPKEIASKVLNYLPSLESLLTGQLEQIINAETRDESILVHLLPNPPSADNSDIELKTLPAKLDSNIKVYNADCSKSHSLCESLDVGPLPKWVMFKQSGGYELCYGKTDSLHQIVAFARESSQSPMITLSKKRYDEVLPSGQMWLIDYFAPWCPPCLRLLSQLRQLHNFVADIHIGTIDCVRHSNLCNQINVNSYPTTIFYMDDGKSHKHVGYHDVAELFEFIQDARNPSVQPLSLDDFDNLVKGRPEGTIWLVDFFAPWCGPCQQLAPEFRKLARNVRQRNPSIHFGSVDCDANQLLCSRNAINAYPTIRLYPSDATQSHQNYPSNWWRDYGSMNRWLNEYLPSKVLRMGDDFYKKVLDSDDVWLIDFFAPWCAHCIQFAPVFEQIAEALEGRVKLAKINCDEWSAICENVGIYAYPTLRLYTGAKNGKRQRMSGIGITLDNANGILHKVNAHLEQFKTSIKTEL